MEAVEARLHADVPVAQAVAVAHGDYRFGNCLTDPTRAARRRPRLGAVHPR